MEKNRSKGRNGEIDFLRFVFAMIIVVFHFNDIYSLGHFKAGAIGVEFFFLLSGVLMAKKAESLYKSAACVPRSNNIPELTWSFLKAKVGTFYGYFIACALINLIVRRIILNGWSFLEICRAIIYDIPSFFMINMAGFSVYGGGVEATTWYLSVMILAFAILFPILLYNYEWAAKIILPIFAIFALGYMYMTCGRIREIDRTVGIFRGGMLRGLAEMSLGVLAWEISKKIKSIRFTAFSEWVLVLVKILSYAGIIVFGCSSLDKKNDIFAILLCTCGIALSFSEVGKTLPDSALSRWLGKISLPVYLIHVVVARISGTIFGYDVETHVIVLTLICSIVAAIVVMYATDAVMSWLKKHKNIFVRTE